MRTLVSFPAWLTVLATLAIGALAAVVARVALRRLIGAEAAAVAGVAGPLMPALGAVFALLAALALSSEATALRSSDQEVAAEAAAASRLAWASTTPGVEGAPVQAALQDYLRSTRAHEWAEADGTGEPETMRALGDLERAVRTAAAGSELGSAQAGELLAGVDTLASLRRERLATSAHELPALYLAVVMAAGLALVVDAAALAIDRSHRIAWLTAGLVRGGVVGARAAPGRDRSVPRRVHHRWRADRRRHRRPRRRRVHRLTRRERSARTKGRPAHLPSREAGR